MPVAVAILRNWVLPIAFGVIALHLLVSAWAYAVSKVSLTFWLWKQFKIAPRDLPVDVSSLFGALIGSLIGAALSYVLIRMVHAPLLRTWLLFALGFLLALVVPSLFEAPDELDLDGLLFVLRIPVIWCFAIASIVVFCLRHRINYRANVP